MCLAENFENPSVEGQAFNFSPLRPINVLELVEHIQILTGCKPLKPLILDNAEGEIHSQFLDSSKAKAILNWQPRYTLEEGLLETIEWYRDYLFKREESLS